MSTENTSAMTALGIAPANAALLVAAGHTPATLRAAREEELAVIEGIGPMNAAAIVRAIQQAPRRL